MLNNARVLEEEYIPQKLPHRNQELNQLSRALRPVERGEPGDSVFIFGPSGAGKTVLARYATRDLREQVVDVETGYVNCWYNYSRYKVLYEILDEINLAVDVHRQSTPQDELLSRLDEYEGTPYVVILDEVDQLQDLKVLYDLYDIRPISMILIANREEMLFSRFDERLQSRFRGNESIGLDSYATHELISILENRVESAIREDAITTEMLEEIAETADGDARVAIKSLKNAIRNANVDNLDKITGEYIHEAVNEARKDIRQKNLKHLQEHQRLLYNLIEEKEEIAPGKLYEEYKARTDDPKSNRTVRNYLSKMRQYNLIEAEGQKRSRKYRVKKTEEDVS